jgi:hypothetical protein
MELAAAIRRALLAVVLCFAAAASPLPAQEAAPTEDRARALLAAEDYERAAAILQTVTEREPGNASAWSLLGYALHQLGDLDGALQAHRRALEFEETAPVSMYNIGLVYSRKGMADSAFHWLLRAKQTGRFDITRVSLAPEGYKLRQDRRFASLFPTREEFADPFVEDANIIHEWTGEQEGDEFGWIAKNIGDVDGDGLNDLTVSAPSHGPGPAGKIYAYSSGSGELLWSQTGRPGERLGLGLAAAGDINHDGVPDVVAGAPGAGKAYIYSGSDGSLLMTQFGWQEGELFGRKVAGVGDVDGDGHDDVLVGAPMNDSNGESAGRAYVFSGSRGSVLLVLNGERAGDRFGSAVAGWSDDRLSLIAVGAPDAGASGGGRTYVYDGLSDAPAFVIDAGATGLELGGMFVSVVGDLDGDSVPDIYTSDWSDAARGHTTGRIYVHSGTDGSELLSLIGESAGDGFGIGTAEAGDVDGDGRDDLVIGAWLHSSAAPAGGRVYIFSGADGMLIRVLTGKVMGETFGFDASGIGDVDGDGATDFLLTSAWSAINGARSGRVYIISGAIGTRP